MEPRKQNILKAVVEEFAQSGIPVGSHSLARARFWNLSSATIRGELSALAELGYLAQPHVSSGRIPTDLGYRYFVDFLMDVSEIPAAEFSYLAREMRQVPLEGQALAEKLANTLATLTHNAAIATTPMGAQARLKHVDFVSLEPHDVLMVLVVEGNLVRQQVLHLEEAVDQAALTRIANKINGNFAASTASEVASRLRRSDPGTEAALLRELSAALDLFGRGGESIAVHDGVRNLIQQPEFAEPARLGEILEVLEESSYLASWLTDLVGDSNLQIVIGSENQAAQFRTCTVVLTTYGPSRRVKGVLGVIGPTRMDYGQVVARLQAVSRTASERLGEALL